MPNNKFLIIFDLDGTLVDSEPLCNQAFLDLLPQLNDSVETLMHRYRGMKLASILVDIEERIGQRLPDNFEGIYRQQVAKRFATDLKPMPGASTMLTTLSNPYCIASSGPPAKIRQALAVTGLAPHFGDRIFSAYDVGAWKPEPGLFLHAAAAMGFLPGHCVVVEDSQPGIEAAVAAGMKTLYYAPHVVAREFADVKTFTDMSCLPTLVNIV